LFNSFILDICEIIKYKFQNYLFPANSNTMQSKEDYAEDVIRISKFAKAMSHPVRVFLHQHI